MSIPIQNSSIQKYSHPLLIGLIYAITIRLLVCPLNFDASTELIGFLGTDTLDTVALRWAFWNDDAHFFPVGWSAYSVTPNILDHLLFAPLLSLPFPLADNVWWLSQLWFSCICAHKFGSTLSTDRFSGWMGGATILLCDSLIRELNWGHAPQAMWWAPICTMITLERWRLSKEIKHLLQSGLFLGISGWCYLYFMPFIALITLVIWGKNWRACLVWGLFGTLIVSGNLWWLYTISPEMTTVPSPPLINGRTLSNIHSATVSSFFSGAPIDISNQVSLVWSVVTFLGAITLWRKDRQLFWLGTVAIILGMGLIAGKNFPLMDLINQIPFMSRMLWPERYGILIVIGMIILVTSASRLRWLIPIALLEFSYRSENIPLNTTSIEPWECVTAIDSKEYGAVLELPLKTGDPLYNQQSLRQRLHKRPLVNPLILPPFVSPPVEWKIIQNAPSIKAFDGEIALEESHKSELLELGINTILVDRVLLSSKEQTQIVAHLTPLLGAPFDLSCAFIWTLNGQVMAEHKSLVYKDYTTPKVQSTQEPL